MLMLLPSINQFPHCQSANYCCTNRTNNTGLLLLCDVALGNMYERTKVGAAKFSCSSLSIQNIKIMVCIDNISSYISTAVLL